MVERICPRCQHGNPLDDRFCGACGTALDRNELAPRSDGSITIAGRQVPMRQIRQVGQAVALSLAAVAAEAGIAWLAKQTQRGTTPVVGDPQPIVRAAQPRSSGENVVTIVSHRIVEVWEEGKLARQTVERHLWRREG